MLSVCVGVCVRMRVCMSILTALFWASRHESRYSEKSLFLLNFGLETLGRRLLGAVILAEKSIVIDFHTLLQQAHTHIRKATPHTMFCKYSELVLTVLRTARLNGLFYSKCHFSISAAFKQLSLHDNCPLQKLIFIDVGY